MITLRESYGRALTALAETHNNILCLSADLASATNTALFAKTFPDRFFNCGIAEGNMFSLSAGLALEGYVPFVSTFAIFSAGRAWEQIRNAIAYQNLHVVIASTHAGLSVGADGATHQCCEDLALMRAIPGMQVLCPCDEQEVKAAVQAAYEASGPVYLRLSRIAARSLHPEGCTLVPGKGEVLRAGDEVALLCTGIMAQAAMDAAEQLAARGISARVIHLPWVKPLDEAQIVDAARHCRLLVTCEEHSTIGGLGEAVSHLLAEQCPTKMLSIGVQDRFGVSGNPEELFRRYGLDADTITARVLAAL